MWVHSGVYVGVSALYGAYPLITPELIIQVAFVAIYADYLRYTSVHHGGFTARDTEASKKREKQGKA